MKYYFYYLYTFKIYSSLSNIQEEEANFICIRNLFLFNYTYFIMCYASYKQNKHVNRFHYVQKLNHFFNCFRFLEQILYKEKQYKFAVMC